MKLLFFTVLALGFLPLSSPMAETPKTTKIYCTSSIPYENIEQLKKNLLINVKRSVSNELFGEFISASTAVEKSVLTNDSIQTSTVGLIRLEGNPKFYNGENLAEACVKVTGTVTNNDLKKFKPIEITKKHCITDPSLTTGKLKETAKSLTVREALYDYNPKLRNANVESINGLMQRIEYLKSDFVEDTETYCVQLKGQIVPIEIIAFENLKNNKQSNKKSKANKKDPLKQWVSEVVKFSSQYNTGGWSANQVLGPPNINDCGDRQGSWTVRGNGTHYIEVKYDKTVKPLQIIVHENNGIGFVRKIMLIDKENKQHSFTVTDTLDSCPGGSVLDIPTEYQIPTNQIRVYIDSAHSNTYEEIDAIALVGHPD